MRSSPQIGELRLDARPSDITTGVLSVVIPYTTPGLTLAALRHAQFCTDLNVHVSLVDVQVVPFPCPLTEPPINNDFSEQRLFEMFEETELPGTTEVVYARDSIEGYRRVLHAASLVILATRKRWWPTKEQKLAHALQKAGHHVMLLRV